MLNKLNDLEILDRNKILGEGAYSEVIKVQTKKDNKLFALKQINLENLSKVACKNLRNEMKLHKSLNHPNIIKFYDALQEHNMVYFLLEYASNGCLYFYIDNQKGIPEHLALRFLYQSALAVQHLHDQNFLHRDIKPENVLLDENFNVKLCDFGWSCLITEKEIRQSICGTYEYMPPEVISNLKQNLKVDIWCLGILLYEFLHGQTPFTAQSVNEIQEELKKKPIYISNKISKNTKDLLKGMLRKNEQDRFDINQVVNHIAFQQTKQNINYPLLPSDRKLLINNYLNNVKSQKTNLPLSVERHIALKQQKIQSSVIKKIKESFFQSADKVQGFFDLIPEQKYAVMKTEDFFNVFEDQENVNKINEKKIQQDQKKEIPNQVQIKEQKIENDEYENLFNNKQNVKVQQMQQTDQVPKTKENFTFNVYQNSFDYFRNDDNKYDPHKYDDFFQQKYQQIKSKAKKKDKDKKEYQNLKNYFNKKQNDNQDTKVKTKPILSQRVVRTQSSVQFQPNNLLGFNYKNKQKGQTDRGQKNYQKQYSKQTSKVINDQINRKKNSLQVPGDLKRHYQSTKQFTKADHKFVVTNGKLVKVMLDQEDDINKNKKTNYKKVLHKYNRKRVNSEAVE